MSRYETKASRFICEADDCERQEVVPGEYSRGPEGWLVFRFDDTREGAEHHACSPEHLEAWIVSKIFVSKVIDIGVQVMNPVSVTLVYRS